jgi:hypothetical protein
VLQSGRSLPSSNGVNAVYESRAMFNNNCDACNAEIKYGKLCLHCQWIEARIIQRHVDKYWWVLLTILVLYAINHV